MAACVPNNYKLCETRVGLAFSSCCLLIALKHLVYLREPGNQFGQATNCVFLPGIGTVEHPFQIGRRPRSKPPGLRIHRTHGDGRDE